MRKLLTDQRGQAKMAKSAKSGLYMPFIMHLAPSTLSGYNTCPMATKGCAQACLNTAGRGRFDSVQKARIARTRMFFEDRDNFFAKLYKEITSAIRKAKKHDKIPVLRLNGTSDIAWEIYKPYDGKTIFETFPEVVFYDYTKIAKRHPKPMPNYTLTFSAADGNDEHVNTAIAKGMNVATVFRKELPSTYIGLDVINGDSDDLRFLDPKGVIVGLTAKGKAKTDTTGFVKC